MHAGGNAGNAGFTHGPNQVEPAESFATVRPEFGFTLLVSFFASQQPPDHYPELMGALRTNLANPALRQVVVLYEPLEAMGCVQLRETLGFGDDSGGASGPTAAANSESTHFTCVTWGAGQPTYKDMFEYASLQPDGYFHGATVVVANTDIVFDASLAQIPTVQDEVFILSVNTPPDSAVYEAAVGRSLCKTTTTPDARCPWPGWKNANTQSWDAFVLRPPLPTGFAATAKKKGVDLGVFMNAIGAENRVKCGLEAAGIEVLNACMYVRMQHWHRCTKQMHHAEDIDGNREAKVITSGKVCDGKTYPCMMYNYGPKAHHVINSQVCLKYTGQFVETTRGKQGATFNWTQARAS
jgi:hypothetical protein